MTTAAYPQADPKAVSMKFSKRPIDPILQEVYEIKAQLNAEAGYSLELLLARAGLGAISKPLEVGTSFTNANKTVRF